MAGENGGGGKLVFRSRRAGYGARRALGALLLAAALSLLGLWIFDVRLLPVIRAMALSGARNLATAAINDAVGKVLTTRRVQYQTLMSLEKDKNGNIIAVEANTGEINLLKYEITNEALRSLNSLNTSALDIPLGTLVGGQLFTGIGPRIRVRVEPVGNVRSEFVNSFTSAGINQTRQEITLDVDAQITVITSGATMNTEVTSNVVVTDMVIVGGVPGTYFEGGGTAAQNAAGYYYGAQQNAAGSSGGSSAPSGGGQK